MVTSTRRRSVSWWIVFAALMGIGDALLAAWWVHNGWGLAMGGLALAGLIVFVAWSFRPPP